jgi:hypothetical protein
MRALCGAIITAGAVLGLGLTAIGFAARYQVVPVRLGAEKPSDTVRENLLAQLHTVDTPLLYIVVFLTCVAIIGLGIAFFGLAYHHRRRHHEHLREEQRAAAHQRTPV